MVTECLSDASLGDSKERSCLMIPSLHFSLLLLLTPFPPSPAMQGAKAATNSPLHPVCTWSVLQSSSWQSWQCHRHVPWWGVFSWLWYAACQGGARTTMKHRAPWAMVQVKRAEESTVPSYQRVLQLSPSQCSVPLWAFWHYCRVTTYYHLSRSFHFLLK